MSRSGIFLTGGLRTTSSRERGWREGRMFKTGEEGIGVGGEIGGEGGGETEGEGGAEAR